MWKGGGTDAVDLEREDGCGAGGTRRSRRGRRKEKPNMKGAETGTADVEL